MKHDSMNNDKMKHYNGKNVFYQNGMIKIDKIKNCSIKIITQELS
jgi:hypothetical protein